jgi:hypothetical protein
MQPNSIEIQAWMTKVLEQSFEDKLTEMVQMLGAKGCDDPTFAWAHAAQEALRAKLITLKFA